MLSAGRASILRRCWSISVLQRRLRQSQTRASGRSVTSMQKTTATQQAPCKLPAENAASIPCDIEAHLSREGKARNLSSLSKFIFSFSGIPGMVSLHGGLPNASIFPFKSMKVELGDGTWLDMSDKEKVTQSVPCLSVLAELLPVGTWKPQAYGNPSTMLLNSACMYNVSLRST